MIVPWQASRSICLARELYDSRDSPTAHAHARHKEPGSTSETKARQSDTIVIVQTQTPNAIKITHTLKAVMEECGIDMADKEDGFLRIV